MWPFLKVVLGRSFPDVTPPKKHQDAVLFVSGLNPRPYTLQFGLLGTRSPKPSLDPKP